MRTGNINPEQVATSAGSKIAVNVFDLAIPGLGVIASLIVGKILRDSAKKEASKVAHFRDAVLSPMISALQAGNYAQAAAMVTRNMPGDAGEEHAGYLLQTYPQTAKAMYQAALGAALTGNPDVARRFAVMLDYFKTQGVIDAAQTTAILQSEAAERYAESTHHYVMDENGEQRRIANNPERGD